MGLIYNLSFKFNLFKNVARIYQVVQYNYNFVIIYAHSTSINLDILVSHCDYNYSVTQSFLPFP